MSRALAILYGATIFLSAFLLFQVQPIMGKQVLPWFGGSAFVWTTCLLFFQGLLLLGYLYCHWIVRFLRPRTQSLLHAALLLASCALLPIIPDAAWKPAGDENPLLRILGLLAATIGLPYFVLSTTGPLMQAWFARERPGTVPYRLFALSNLGSMLALLGYPFAVEPVLESRTQSWIWSSGFLLFVLMCLTLALRGARHADTLGEGERRRTVAAPPARELILWVALAACPSLLLMAITTHLTQNVAPVPLLWVLPLALYLLSFILCFEHPRWYQRGVFIPLFLAGIAAVAYLPNVADSALDLRLRIGAYLLSLFALCMVCHGELFRRRPDLAHLTTFYLMIALGGALGGVFVAVIAPLFFVSDFELAIGLAVTAALVLYVFLCLPQVGQRPSLRWALALAGFAVLGALGYAFGKEQWTSLRAARTTQRDFYGTLRVRDVATENGTYRRLIHGNIIHGEQFLDSERRRQPTTYYGEQGGGGLAILARRGAGPQRIGVVGLGAGTLMAYGREGDYVRAYEINPRVIELARSEFFFLADSPARLDIVLGDARLALERDAAQGFDVLLVDAFSGDSVPVHLLTLEAFRLYLAHLRPGGVLAVHVSNKFLDLAPIVALAAQRLERRAVLVTNEADEDKRIFRAFWVLVSDNPFVIEDKAVLARAKDIGKHDNLRPWTDSYSSLYAVLR